MNKFHYLFVFLSLASTLAFAGNNQNTDHEQWRPMTTERPSKTDSPYSIDKGLHQIEMNLYGYSHDENCSGNDCALSRKRTIGGSTNLRIGLTDNADIQFIGDIYTREDRNEEITDARTTLRGYGDTLVRLKINLLGNMPSDTYSLGLLPYIKLPTHRHGLGRDKLEGGIGLPFNINFDNGWSLGGMTQLNLVRAAEVSGYKTAFAHSIMLGKSFSDSISAYAEFYTYKENLPASEREDYLDFGLVYALTKNLRFDINTHWGVSSAAVDKNIYFGTAFRF